MCYFIQLTLHSVIASREHDYRRTATPHIIRSNRPKHTQLRIPYPGQFQYPTCLLACLTFFFFLSALQIPLARHFVCLFAFSFFFASFDSWTIGILSIYPLIFLFSSFLLACFGQHIGIMLWPHIITPTYRLHSVDLLLFFFCPRTLEPKN